jgi:hypothetical protein
MDALQVSNKFSTEDFISYCDGCTLWRTPFTRIDRVKEELHYVCSEIDGDFMFHRKLKLYQNKRGFYINVRDVRCYATDFIHKWISK